MKGTSEREIGKYTPAYEPISLRGPSQQEAELDQSLLDFMANEKEMQLEDDAEMLRRDSVLAEVRNIFLTWVQYVATEVLHLPPEEAEEAGGELFISGSQRLGVRDIGADIDTVCVAPNFCTKEHFFTHLKDMLLNNPAVEELTAVSEAFVPIMAFDFRGVSIDLLFARLAENSVPRDVDILDDKILSGLDDATVVSLNGPRVTNMIFKLVGEKTYPNFLIVLRCIRRWAKKRGLYGNKLGYLGGVNCNILVAFLCQLYPNSGPSFLLIKFFRLYSEWKWPEPIMLNNIQPDPPGTSLSDQREIWSKEKNPTAIMPIITPAYPAMNSLHNVTSHTFALMCQEFKLAHEVLETVVRDKGKDGAWERLFNYSNFFLKYSHYLQCNIVGIGDDGESRRWMGFCESRIRRLLQYLEILPIKAPIHLLPHTSPTQVSANSFCYFIGFDFDLDFLAQVDNKSIHIDDAVFRFQDSLLDPERGYKGERLEGLDFYVDHLTWNKLPKEVFARYGGKAEAKQLRIQAGYGARLTTKRKAKVEDEEEEQEQVENEAEDKKTSLQVKFENALEDADAATDGAQDAAAEGEQDESTESPENPAVLKKRALEHAKAVAIRKKFQRRLEQVVGVTMTGTSTIAGSESYASGGGGGGSSTTNIYLGVHGKQDVNAAEVPFLSASVNHTLANQGPGVVQGVKRVTNSDYSVPNVVWSVLENK